MTTDISSRVDLRNVSYMAVLLTEAIRQLGGTLKVSDAVLVVGGTPVFSQRYDDARQELTLQIDEGGFDE